MIDHYLRNLLSPRPVDAGCCRDPRLDEMAETTPFGGRCAVCATGLCYDTDGWRRCGAGLCRPARLREEEAPVTDPGIVLLGLAFFDAFFDALRADLAAQGIVLDAADWLLDAADWLLGEDE